MEMPKSNYQIMKGQMAKRFLQYDQKQMTEKFQLPCDEEYIYVTFVSSLYRINRKTGEIILSATFAMTPGDSAAIRTLSKKNMTARREKQPLEYPNAGSIFKRPPCAYAGALIENAGLKGMRIGGAEVSEKHAGFIINKGGATCKDVCDLVELIQKTVKDKTGYQLERELIIVE